MDRLGLRAVSTIGLTGGIGSGKSTVAGLLVARGATLVDTDAISRALTGAAGAAMPALAALFGNTAVAADGSLDRDYMRRLVFADSTARARLEAVLHPLIGEEARRQAAAAASSGQVVVFDVPLLAESSHWRRRVDRVLVVDCSAATQLARVVQRPGWTEDVASRVIGQQATREARRAIADAVIFNDGLDLPALRHRIDALWDLWQPANAA